MKKTSVILLFSLFVISLGCKKKNEETPTTPPSITLSGSSTVTLALGDTYTESGATAKDVQGNDVSVTINNSNLDTTSAGTYQIVYTATDCWGNTAQKSRTVTIEITKGHWLASWNLDNTFSACTPSAKILDNTCAITEFASVFTLDHNGKNFTASVTGQDIVVDTTAVSLNLGICGYDVFATGSMSNNGDTITMSYTRIGTQLGSNDATETVIYTRQ